MCWHKYPKKWKTASVWAKSGVPADQTKTCLKCNKVKIRRVA